MTKRIRGRIASILVLVLLSLTFFPNGVRAAEPQVDNANGESMGSDLSHIEENEESTETNGDGTDGQAVDEQSAEGETAPEEDDQEEMVTKPGVINYVGVGAPYLQTPAEQQLVVSFGDGTENISDARLISKKSDGSSVEFGLTLKENELYLFERTFDNKDAGIYHLERFIYVQDGAENVIELSDVGIEAMFGVDEDYQTGEEKGRSVSAEKIEEIEASVVTVDLNAVEDVETDIEEAIEETVEIVETEEGASEKEKNIVSSAADSVFHSVADVLMPAATVKAAEDVIVVLDPGHGGSDSGASANGLVEKDLNLRIAKACKSELEQYNGVTVYMTRDNDTFVELEERARRAKAWGADIFVSLHMNSATAGANGVEVYYPNRGHNADVHNKGEALARQIQNQLVSLGLNDRNIKFKNATDGSKYDDGSLMDYYSVIRNNKLNGIPGIIVEHAFLTNSSDAARLKDDNFVRQLGIADATGIANYFNLSKGPSIKVEDKNDFNGTAQIKVTGLGNNAKVTITNEESKKSKDYPVESGKGTVGFKVSDFNNVRGNYRIEAKNASGSVLCQDSFYVSKDTGSEITLQLDESEKKCVVNIEFKDMPSEVQGVSVPTWQSKDQSDIIWYNARLVSKGKWQAIINISDFKKSGLYNVHVYANLTGGQSAGLGSKTMEISSPSLKGNIQNYNAEKGTFDVIITDIESKSGVSMVQVPVWCANNQSDIKWYDAVKQNDGSYKATISMSNHNYATGNYKVHAYLTAGNGIVAGYAVGEQKVTLPDVGILVNDTDQKETKFELKVLNVGRLGNVKSVQFAVWSEKGGQDDLIWYTGNKNSLGEWTAIADIGKHKTAGIYHVHVYATLVDGTVRGVGGETFEVASPGMDTAIENYAENKGTFDVVISNIQSKSGVSVVQVPVWCAKDQNDIAWYDAKKQSDGSYKATVSISNHKFSTGNYQVHAYLTAKNGLTYGKVVGEQKMTVPNMEISAANISGKDTEYALKVSNVELLGVIKEVSFATWSEKGGQDDLIWYSGSRNSLGEWTATADIRKHKTPGLYNVHVYATLANGVVKGLGITTFDVENPGMTGSLKNYNENKGTFEVVADGIQSKSGVSRIQVPVWCLNDQSDIRWYDAEKQNDGSYKAVVSIANHNYATGKYKVHAYLTAGNEIVTGMVAGEQSVIIPNLEIEAVPASEKEMKYDLRAANVELLGVVRGVQFAVWSEKGGQDDLVWYTGYKNSLGEWTASVEINKHKTSGLYNVHVYATLANGTVKGLGTTTFEVSDPSVSAIEVPDYDDASGMFTVKITGLKAASGITKVEVPVWCAADQNDIRWYTAEKVGEGTYSVDVDPMYHKYHSGLYKIHVYVGTGNGLFKNIGGISQQVSATKYYTIMGESTTTVEQMVEYFKSSNADYPGLELGAGGAATVEKFCQIYYEEAEAEGVRAEVAFAQAMKETGWLRYGGIVKIEQFNFAGIGALDGNSAGQCASFRDVREGVRAQIQHLKAYGSEEPLNNACVDPRFGKVKRGCAPYVEWLGIKENPDGYGWATAEGYGHSIVDMIKKLKMS